MPLTPKQSADDALSRARAILTYSQDYELPSGVEDDLVRTALSMGVAALDTYLHAAVMRSVDAWTFPTSVGRLDIRFDDLCELVEQTTADRRKDPRSRPWVRVKEMLRERLLKESFQSSRNVEGAMLMCGKRNGWHKISEELGEDKDELKKRLDRMVHRRNRIVHESDLARESRPQRIKHERIDATEVEDDLDWLERLIEAIDTVVTL